MLSQYRENPSADFNLLRPFLAGDQSGQSSAGHEIAHFLGNCFAGRLRALEIGPGDGASLRHFRESKPTWNWIGVDIPDSAEVRAAAASRWKRVHYDGVHLPFPANVFDVAYSRQVFEHVDYPAELLTEIHRVMKPGGLLIGSASHLEPFHSRSLQNFTPYGFALRLKRAGFAGIFLRPGIDGITLILRRPLRRIGLRFIDSYFERESVVNRFLELAGRAARLPVESRSALKLQFCGHFTFKAIKGAESPAHPQRS